MRRPRQLVRWIVKIGWGIASAWGLLVTAAACVVGVALWLPMRYGAVPSIAIVLSGVYGTAIWYQAWHTRKTLGDNSGTALTVFRLGPGIGAAVMWCATMAIFPVWDTRWAAVACIVGVAISKILLVVLTEAYVNRTATETDEPPHKWVEQTGPRVGIAAIMVVLFWSSVVGAVVQSDTRRSDRDDTAEQTTTSTPATTAPPTTTTEPTDRAAPPAEPVAGDDPDYTG
jgi:hypothetical protein